MAAKGKKAKASGREVAAKIKFLAVLPAEAIRQLKLAALERSTAEKSITASAVLEEAVEAWMKAHRNSKWKSSEAETGEKRQFKSHMDADVIRELKIFAMDNRETASAVVRDAVRDWMVAQSASEDRKETDSKI